MYGIMSYTESNNLDGLLMLIDFEKVFDSISLNLCIMLYINFDSFLSG